MAGEGTVFDKLLACSLESFADTYVNEIKTVYEYDAVEIREFLTTFNSPNDGLKFVALSSLRQLLLETMRSKLPAVCANKQLYNRKKTETIANDIYILGYCVVNEREDTRLSRIFKNPSDSNIDPHADETPRAIATDSTAADTVELVEVCLNLQNDVVCLTRLVKGLQSDILSLSEKLRASGTAHCLHDVMLQNPQPVNDPAVEVGPPPSAPSTVDNGSQSVDQTAGNPVPTTTPSTGQTPVADAEHLLDTDTPPTGQIQTLGQFALPRDQRNRVKNGKAFNGSNRQEVEGSATRQMSIEGIQDNSLNAQALKSVYVGRLSDKTTTSTVRSHLREVGVTQVCDIIDLKCKMAGQASFCIVAEDCNAEEAIYNPSIWPRGAKIRPFKEKNNNQQPRKVGNHQWNQRGPRLRNHNNNHRGNQRTPAPSRSATPSPVSSESSSRALTTPSPTPSPAVPVTPPISPQVWYPAPHSQRPMVPYHQQMMYDPFTLNRFSPLMWQSNALHNM